MGSEANNRALWGRISVSSGMQSTAACMCDHEVETESDAERRRLTGVLVQRHRRAEDDS